LVRERNRKVEEFKLKREVYKRRLVRFYKNPVAVPLMLIEAKDYAELQTRGEYIKAIVNSDRKMLDKVQALYEDIEDKRAEVDEQMAKVKQVEQQLRLSRADLVGEQKKKRGVMMALQTDIVAFERAIQELEAISNEIAAEIDRQSAVYSRGLSRDGFMAPVVCRQTSSFGYRVHPITRTRRMHTGIDLGCPYGTPIRAASSGRVFWASWKRGYGNTVILVHAGGLSTLYGHMSKIDVSGGQVVRRGQVVGKVGSTGFSTGNHLHYEVHSNGKVINPSPYLR
jgi:murein DD-endopeptidase MepM/ murein hydrolase activator NlpD